MSIRDEQRLKHYDSLLNDALEQDHHHRQRGNYEWADRQLADAAKYAAITAALRLREKGQP